MITLDEIRTKEIKALSWKEPYGSLMFFGKIETRTWYTKYRGLVLICISLKSYDRLTVFNISGYEEHPMIHIGKSVSDGYLGKAIGIGRLVNVEPMKPADSKMAFVKYNKQLYSHFYEDVTPIIPMPWKGSLGFKNVPDSFVQRIKLLDR